MDFKSFIKGKKKLNKMIFNFIWLNIKKFFNLNSKVYEENILLKKIKELMELITSIILKCTNYIKFLSIRCYEREIKRELKGSFTLMANRLNQLPDI